MSRALPFPAQPAPGLATPPWLVERGFRLRPARDDDLPRLRDLYADVRAGEMAGVPWPAAVKRSFLDGQFELQHQHYLQHYASAEFLVVEHEDVVQGRYYLQRLPGAYLIVDISLMATCRGRGIGRALIEASQREAREHGRGMVLHVLRTNPDALRLYQRLGFELSGGTDTHHRMAWAAPGLS